MVLVSRNTDFDETMPQTVPSAGFTPPCDYTNFAENFDLSLLPGGEDPTFNQFYPTPTTQSLLLTTTTTAVATTTSNKEQTPKIFTSFYNQNNNATIPTELSLDFEAELSPKKYENIFFQSLNNNNNNNTNNLLDISVNGNLLSPTSSDQFGQYRQSNEAYFYPSSPELSLYTPSPNSSIYSQSPRDDLYANQLDIKQENFLSSPGPASPATSCSSISGYNSFEKIVIKEETTTDFANLLNNYQTPPTESTTIISTKDHQLLREALRDTSFQKKYNIRPIDFEFVGDFKMKEPDDDNNAQNDLMRENIEPVFNMAIEQMKKDIVNTCTALRISPDPHQWSSNNIFAWLQWTSRQFDLNDPIPEQWDMNGTTLLTLTEDDFVKRAPQGGMMLYAQLEIWKAAHSEVDLNPQRLTETTSSNASSGDISEDDDDESNSSQPEPNRPSTSTRSGGPSIKNNNNNNNNNSGGTHIHLWQFLKELLQQSQSYGSCIRWLDRTKGIFKIEDSVKVARLWGKRKNRPAMNYDKLSRSIRQYYKKGIMKKTERSQRLVYQFCHPYNL